MNTNDTFNYLALIDHHKQHHAEEDKTNTELAQLRAALAEAREAMAEIAKGDGAFSRNPLTHAGNCIEKAVGIAEKYLSAHPEEP